MDTQSATMGKWEWNLLTKKYSWCEEMHRIFKIPRQNFSPRTGSFFNCVHPEDKERVVRAFGQALVNQQPYRLEHRIVLPDGSVRHVRGDAQVNFDQAGRPVSMSGTIIDITSMRLPKTAAGNEQLPEAAAYSQSRRA